MESPQAHNVRRLAKPFTASTPLHHPLLDPSLPAEDIPMVPRDLAPRGRLSWELPKKTRTNLHIMLKLSNETDELLDEFHQRIPKIDEILQEWAEFRGASPTSTGEEQLRSQYMRRFKDWEAEKLEPKAKGEHCIFNMKRHLDTPGRADVIYLTDPINNSDGECEDNVESNIQSMDWLDFDASYVHLTGVGGASEREDMVSEVCKASQSDANHCSSAPPTFRNPKWDCDRDIFLTSNVYIPPNASPSGEPERGKGPYENFWLQHAYPYGETLLNSSDDELSPCLTPPFAMDARQIF